MPPLSNCCPPTIWLTKCLSNLFLFLLLCQLGLNILLKTSLDITCLSDFMYFSSIRWDLEKILGHLLTQCYFPVNEMYLYSDDTISVFVLLIACISIKFCGILTTVLFSLLHLWSIMENRVKPMMISYMLELPSDYQMTIFYAAFWGWFQPLLYIIYSCFFLYHLVLVAINNFFCHVQML